MAKIRDKDIDWIRARKFYDIFSWNGLYSFAVGSQDAGELIGAPSSSDIHLLKVSSTGLVGLVVDSVRTGISACFVLPYDVDVNHPLGFRLLFTQSTGSLSSCTVTWAIYWQILVPAGTIRAPTDALDVALEATDISDTAWVLHWTSRGILSADSLNLSRSDIESGCMLNLEIQLDDYTAGVTDPTLLGLELDYAPQRTLGSGNPSDPPLTI